MQRWFWLNDVAMRNWQGFTIYLTVERTYGVRAADDEWLGDYETLGEAKRAVKDYNYANVA